MTNTFNPRWFLPPFFLVEDIIEDNLESKVWTSQEVIDIQKMAGLTEEDVAALKVGAKPIDEKLAEKFSYFYGGSKEYWLNLERNFRQDLNRRKISLGFLNVCFLDVSNDGSISLSIGLLKRYEVTFISSCKYEDGEGWLSVELLDFKGPGQPLSIFDWSIGL